MGRLHFKYLFTIEVDPHKCTLGQWYYSHERQEAEKFYPEIQTLLRGIEEPHRLLHESASNIEDAYKVSDNELPSFLAQKIIDHFEWSQDIVDAILLKQDDLEVELDPTRCSLGQFLYGEKRKEVGESDALLARSL